MQAVFDALDGESADAAEASSGIGEILECVGRHDRTNNAAGSRDAAVHAQRMRTTKAWRGKLRKRSIMSPAARAAAVRCNMKFAVRAADIIPLEDQPGKGKPGRAQAGVPRGRGAHRKWMPFAVLRCCFGLVNHGAGTRRCRGVRITHSRFSFKCVSIGAFSKMFRARVFLI